MIVLIISVTMPIYYPVSARYKHKRFSKNYLKSFKAHDLVDNIHVGKRGFSDFPNIVSMDVEGAINQESDHMFYYNDLVRRDLIISSDILSNNNNSAVVLIKIRKISLDNLKLLNISFKTENCKLINSTNILLSSSELEGLNKGLDIELKIIVLKNNTEIGKILVWARGKTCKNNTIVGSKSILLTDHENYKWIIGKTKKIDDYKHPNSKMNSKSPGTLIVYGWWYYENSNGEQVPIKNALVILYDDDTLTTWELARTYTDENGYFEFPPIENNDGYLEDGYDVWVAVYCENSIVKVTDGGTNSYAFRTSKTDNVPDGYFYIGSWVVVDDQLTQLYEPGCFEIFEHVNEAANWLYQQTLWRRSQVTVYWPYGDWPCTDGNIIYIPEGDWYSNAATIYHEYGHDVMYEAYGYRWPDSGNYDGHYVFSDTDFGFAFIEGWAEFFECAVDNNPYNLADLGMNIENNTWFNVVDEDDLDGAYVEGSVASILWDIFDEIDLWENDSLSLGFDEIFNVLLNYNPNNIHEFWDYFINDYGYEEQLRDIYFHYGVNKGVKTKWTVMIYLDGDNNLESSAINDVLEMASVGSNEDVSIVIMFDRSEYYDTSYNDWTYTRIFYVVKGFEPYPYNALENLGEQNMGDPNTLYSFVTYVIENYPSDKYILVLWDHGSGWEGCCLDDSHNSDILDTWEIRLALNWVKSDYPNFHLDIIGFDACLMASLEAAYEIYNEFTDFMVASEETEPGDGWPYDEILDLIKSYPDLSSDEIADLIAYLYVNS